MKLTELKPERVFYWFNEICKIPHGSGNTRAISDLCEEFAKNRKLKYYRDDIGNIIIFKDASADRQGSSSVILQGHLDMVCNKISECTKDMAAEGIEPMTDGEYVWANGTTLGADDGIAAAYIFTILEADDISHPPIEAVLTVDEEIGLIGATELDCGMLKARRGINIDSEEEGYITVSCAGGVRVSVKVPMTLTAASEDMAYAELSVSGLIGGHSGIDINKNRNNAIKVLARLLDKLMHIADVRICSLNGGAAMNIIPQNADAVIAFPNDKADEVISAAEGFGSKAKEEYRATDPAIKVSANIISSKAAYTDKSSAQRLVFILMHTPDGVISMNPEIPGMVQSSLNTGIVSFDGDILDICCFVRSNDNMEKQIVVDKLLSFYSYLEADVSLDSDYPAWAYRSESPLRDEAVRTYNELYGSEPQVIAIHAGLECGILSSKLGDADFISFGPDIENAHTPDERLNAASAQRCYNYLLSLLKNI